MSLFNEFVTRELKKRAILNIDTSGNVPANKVLLTSGIGTRAEAKTIPILGDWEWKDTDFNIENYKNYLIDTETSIVNATLPLAPIDKQLVWVRDAKATFGTNSAFILRHPSATYTIEGVADDLELDYSKDIFLIFDLASNNWSL